MLASRIGNAFIRPSTRRCRRFVSSPSSSSLSPSSSGSITQDRENSVLNESDGTIAFGYDVVLKRVAGMIKTVTDRQATKILHVHPEGNLVAYLGESTSTFDIVGCSDCTGVDAQFEGSNKYSKIEYLTFENGKELPFRGQSFQFVINCTPTTFDLQSAFTRSVWANEMLRVMAEGGYGVVGMESTLWESMNMTEQLFELDESPAPVQLLSIQEIPYSSSTASRYSTDDKEQEEEEIHMNATYSLALMRRK